MMFSFRRQTGSWQQRWQRQQNAGPVQRLIAWLVMGIVLLFGAMLMLVLLVFSWLLIPILLWRYRRKMRAFQQAAQQAQQQHQQQSHDRQGQDSSHRVIEGEVLDKKED
jgi:flagellar biosynthesis/type III secretory pathway M-ring protein FliF/YscJ